MHVLLVLIFIDDTTSCVPRKKNKLSLAAISDRKRRAQRRHAKGLGKPTGIVQPSLYMHYSYTTLLQCMWI